MQQPVTETANPASAEIDRMSTLEVMRLINAEDQTVAAAVNRALPQIALAADLIACRLRDGGRLFYVGAGTSGRLGFLDAAECVPTFGTDPEQVQGLIAGGDGALLRAIEGAEDDAAAARRDLMMRGLRSNDVVCGIAASGRTPYVIGALEYANSLSAATVAICCNLDAPMLDLARAKIAVDVGAEVIAGSTRMKAGSAQKMILNMLSTAAMIQLGKIYGNRMVDLKVTNKKLKARAKRLVVELTEASEDQAASWLERADDEVKTAIVMGKLGVDPATARRRLAMADGFLRRVIDQEE